jgi:putative hydrolase of the HAD superfamily
MSLLPDPHIRALLLDAMGTLIRLEPPAPALRRELRTRFGLEISATEAAQAMRAEIAYYRGHMHAAADADGVQRLREDSAAALRAALPAGRRLQDIGAPELAEALIASLRFTPYQDARPALQTARRHGLRVVVVSNWDASLPHVLAAAGLADLLDGIITSAAAGAAKPAVHIFRTALNAAGVGPAQALHVGDSQKEDVAGAQAAGIRALWLTRTTSAAPDDMAAIHSLADLFATA